jgi:hypothetical protein
LLWLLPVPLRVISRQSLTSMEGEGARLIL